MAQAFSTHYAPLTLEKTLKNKSKFIIKYFQVVFRIDQDFQESKSFSTHATFMVWTLKIIISVFSAEYQRVAAEKQLVINPNDFLGIKCP